MWLLLLTRARYFLLSSRMYVFIAGVPESEVSIALGAFLGSRKHDLIALLRSFSSLRYFVLEMLSSNGAAYVSEDLISVSNKFNLVFLATCESVLFM